MAEHTELTLFSAESNPAPVAGLPVAPISALPHLLQNFDRVISVLGNSGYHSEIYDLLTRYGGAAICHDSRLLHFYIHKNGAWSAARLAGEELQRAVSEAELALWVQDETRREASLLGEAARHAQPLIFHAQASAELVRQRFNADARYLPFALPHSWTASVLDAAEKRAAKLRLGLDPRRIHIASFGFLTPNKGADRALAALRLLRQCGIDAHLHFVGEPDPASTPVLDQAGALGLERHVSLAAGYVAPARYRDYFLAADLGLQLRNTGAGSISGALQDCIAAGLPTVANEALAAALDAPGYVARVPDRLDPGEITAALAGLIENPPAALAEQRAEYCAFHSMKNYAARLCEILELEV
jgi:glycosyltransferase involved in cell wall biosynthesis